MQRLRPRVEDVPRQQVLWKRLSRLRKKAAPHLFCQHLTSRSALILLFLLFKPQTRSMMQNTHDAAGPLVCNGRYADQRWTVLMATDRKHME